MNVSKNKTLVGVVVTVLVLGVAMTYVPLLFSPQSQAPAAPAADALPSSQQTASLPDAIKTTSTPSASGIAPQTHGFSGLNEESQNLNNLNDLLNQK